MKTALSFLVMLLATATGALGENYLSYVECHNGDGTLEYHQDGAVSLGGEQVTVFGLFENGTRYSRDPETGKLSFVADLTFLSSGLNVAQLSPGRFLYLARGYSNSILVMDRAADGTVTLVQTVTDDTDGVDGLENTSGICVSADGKNVYATGRDDDAVAVFSRNATDGTLTFVEAHFDTDPGVDGLDGALSIAISPNGDFVYVGSEQDNAIAIFQRNETTGALTYSGMISDSDAGVSGLGYPRVMVVTPLTEFLYVSGDGVTVLQRDLATGALTFVENTNLAFAYAMAAQPKANRLYVASSTGDSVTIFETDENDGTLTELGEVVNNTDGITCIEDPSAVFIAPGGASLYVGGQNGNLAVFSIGIFGDGFETGDYSSWNETSSF